MFNDYDYYEDGLIYGYDDEKKQKLCQKQEQTEAEALELTYSHLGRLLQSAEMLAYKLNLTKNNYQLKYQSYDSFNVAGKKDIDTLKYDVINFLDFYEKAIIIHNKKFKYELPKSISQLINDLQYWKRNAQKNDKRFFSAILDLINKGSYDYSLFPDENILYEKAKKDNSKFRKNASLWKTFSIPILKFLNDLIKSTKEKVNRNPNYKPDIHFGSATNNTELKNTHESYFLELKINNKLNEINNILLYITSKKLNKLDPLVKSVQEFNDLYTDYKNKYGNEIELDQNTLSSIKEKIAELKLKDSKTLNMLKNITIEIDENNYQ